VDLFNRIRQDEAPSGLETGRGALAEGSGEGVHGFLRERVVSPHVTAVMDLLIAEELKLGRWQEADLKTRPKGDSVKVALAARLRAETTMTVGWIAERLAMGTRGYLNHFLFRRRKLGEEYPISRTDPFTTETLTIQYYRKCRRVLKSLWNFFNQTTNSLSMIRGTRLLPNFILFITIYIST